MQIIHKLSQNVHSFGFTKRQIFHQVLKHCSGTKNVINVGYTSSFLKSEHIYLLITPYWMYRFEKVKYKNVILKNMFYIWRFYASSPSLSL